MYLWGCVYCNTQVNANLSVQILKQGWVSFLGNFESQVMFRGFGVQMQKTNQVIRSWHLWIDKSSRHVLKWVVGFNTSVWSLASVAKECTGHRGCLASFKGQSVTDPWRIILAPNLSTPLWVGSFGLVSTQTMKELCIWLDKWRPLGGE